MVKKYASLVLTILTVLGLLLSIPAAAGQAQATQPDPGRPRPGRQGGRDNLLYLDPAGSTATPWQSQSPAAVDAPRLPWSKVVFESYRDGNYEIYSANDDGSGLARLTINPADDIQPRLNRGGTKIAFVSNRDGNAEIYSMNPDGSGLVQLTNTPTDDWIPAWSPDGTRIAFQSYRDTDGLSEIYIMNADGSNQTRLTYWSGWDGRPTWSPDGTKIAWASDRNSTAGGIWVMNADGSEPHQILAEKWSDNPSWSPDGSRIAFDADPDNDTWQEVMVVNADGSNPQVAYDPNNAYEDAWARGWSPDGAWIIYTHIYYTLQGTTLYWTGAFLKMVAPAPLPGTETTLLGTNKDWLPDWQTLDAAPPSSAVLPLPAYSQGPFQVQWSGSDPGGAGLKSFDVQVRDTAGGAWSDWLTATSAASGVYIGVSGHTYLFRSRARDNAFNLEAWPLDPLGDASTTQYTFGLTGSVRDNTGMPISGATITTNPAAFATLSGPAPGAYAVYVATSEPKATVSANWTRTGYGSPPETSFNAPGTEQVEVVLPPADNGVVNSGLEFAGAPAAPWISGGTITPVTSLARHTGATSVRLGQVVAQNRQAAPASPLASSSSLSQTVTLAPGISTPVLSFFYQLNGASSANQAHFDVTVTAGGNTDTVFTTSANTSAWTHHWLDLTLYAGQAITVTFALDQVDGQPPAAAFLDDVTIGSASPDLAVAGSTPASAPPGATIQTTLVYENLNFAPAAGVTLTVTLPDKVTFISADLAPTTTAGQTLTWNLGPVAGRSGPGAIHITLKVAPDAGLLTTLTGSLQIHTTSPEPEQGNNTAALSYFIGYRNFIPVIRK